MKLTINNVKVSLLLKIVLVSAFFISSIDSNAYSENLKSKFLILKYQDSIAHTEKVYLHFDKPYYSSGEFIWFKTYLVNANTNTPNTLSKIVYVELIDFSNKIIDSKTIKIENGGGHGEFYLPLQLSSGEYTIRAYTNFMRNFDAAYFFTKKINIRNQQSLASKQPQLINTSSKNNTKETIVEFKPDLQFFPEGGYMIANKANTLAFKAIGTDGKSIAVSGTILNSKNKIIQLFKTQKLGFGKFEFIPKKDEIYKATINFEGNDYTYKLPKALETGVTMKVIDRKDKYQVYLISSLPKGVRGLTLTALQNGKIVSIGQLKGTKDKGVINIPKKDLKLGIAQFTILDNDQNPLCERLVFADTDKVLPTISISPNKKQYQKRELIELNFDLNGIEQANASVTVTDVSVVNTDAYGLDIKSHLLLNSELKGEIEQPGYYFDLKNNDRKQLLDLLMLTQGWRQFLWNDADNNAIYGNKKKYDHETGISIKGTIKNKDDLEQTASTEVSLTYMNKDEMVEDKLRSLKDGKFQFGDYQFNDSTSIIIQAKNYKIRKRKRKEDLKEVVKDYTIELDSFIPHPIKNKSLQLNKNIETIGELIESDYIARSRKARLNSVIPFDDEFEKLEEVTVKHTRVKKEIKEKFKNRKIVYGRPSYRVDMDNIETTISNKNVLASLRGKVPGLRITGDIDNPIVGISWPSSSSAGSGSSPGALVHSTPTEPTISRNYSLRIRGGLVDPLILVNNFPVQDISGILASDVSFVDILSPARSAMFGSRGMGGVISIHTKRGNEDRFLEKKERNGIVNFIHPGFYKARKFYKPNYSIDKPEHKKFDYRTTIHWEPTIQQNTAKKLKTSFYAADIATTYKIELQGISKEGIPIISEAYVVVE